MKAGLLAGERGAAFFKRACELGEIDGCYRPERVGCESGIAEACLKLASIYESSDKERAAGFHARACLLGQSDACARGASALEMLCSDGDGRACERLGRLYADGRALGKDFSRAASLLGKACKLGVRTACARP